MSESGGFDSAPIAMLQRVGGSGLVGKMIELFREGSAPKLRAARAALDAGDPAAFALAAHSLKSSAGQLGLVRLQGMCSALEKTPFTPETRESVLGELAAAEAELDRAILHLDRVLQSGVEA